jgi:hypothetical protein
MALRTKPEGCRPLWVARLSVALRFSGEVRLPAVPARLGSRPEPLKRSCCRQPPLRDTSSRSSPGPGAYAVITLLLGVLGPVMASWPLPLRTLLLSALMVSALTGAIMPMLARIFRGWLVAH